MTTFGLAKLRRTSSYTLARVALVGITIALRLGQITQPYVDAWSCRQADVAMIARNIYCDGFDLLHPRMDWAGHLPGCAGGDVRCRLNHLAYGVARTNAKIVCCLRFVSV